MADGLAGRMRARVAIERWVGAADGLGGVIAPAWRAERRVWAELTAQSARIVDEADATALKARFRATMRPCPLDRGQRLRWGARAFGVLGVERDPATPDRITATLEEVTP